MYPRVSIIILNWNGWKDTIECLESVYQITYPNYDVIVVDNGSSDESIEKIKEYCEGKIKVESKFFEYSNENKPIRVVEYTREEAEAGGGREKEILDLPPNRKLILIKNEKNYGFAEGNNIGMRYALKTLNPDYILLLNNDTVVDKEFLTKLIHETEKNKLIGLASPIIYEYFEEKKIQYAREKIKWYTGRIEMIKESVFGEQIIKSDTICGASMLIRKDVIDKIGLLPTGYFMLWEDIDYSTNAIRNGFICAYIQHSRIWHKGSVSIGKISSPFRIRYSIRNRFIFWKKYSTKFQLCSFLIFTIMFHIPLLLIIGVIKSNHKRKFLSSAMDGLAEGLRVLIANK